MQPMIPWRQVQKENFTNVQKLADYLNLPSAHFIENPRFPLNIPKRLAEKIKKNTLDDPILRQYLPLKEELQKSPGFTSDPIGDLSARKAKKLLHKYRGRALLVCTSACAVHCRFCFRQNFPYETETSSFQSELDAIGADSSITEILLSGGDPLSLSDRALQDLILKLDAIAHLKRLRIHTRFPIGIPERIDASFLSLLQQTRLQIVFVIHVNHVKELDADVLQALNRIQRLGIPVLSQTVLLKEVNDSVNTLKELLEKMIDHGIIPYYIHQLDRVEGAHHYEVSEAEGLKLLDTLSQELPGYAIPRYVKEIAGEASKTPVRSYTCS
jgi:lysine 2,3-aminomutase